MSRKYLLIIAAIVMVGLSCVKNDELLDENDKSILFDDNAFAQVKFINAFPSATPAAVPLTATAATGPGFRIFVDGLKVDATLNSSNVTNVLFYGNVFPGTTSYIRVPFGQRQFNFTINRTSGGNFAPIAGDNVFNLTRHMAPGKNYSLFLVDTLPNPSVFVTEDNYKEPIRNNYGIRFINLCADVNRRFDLMSQRHGIKLFTNVGYKEATEFIYEPILSSTSDTLYLMNAGTNTVVAQVNGFVPTPQRVYTFYARGKTGVANRAPSLTFYTNK